MRRPDRAAERLWAPSEQRVEVLVALRDVLDDDRLSMQTTLGRAPRVLARSLGDGIAIDLLSPDGRWMVPTGVDHADPALREVLKEIVGVRFRADEGFTANVVDRHEGVLLPRVSAEEIEALQPAIAGVCEALSMQGFVAVPIIARQRLLGILWQVRSRPAPQLSEDDERFADEVASRLAFALLSFPDWDAGALTAS
jgi:GAF domain-containing protein